MEEFKLIPQSLTQYLASIINIPRINFDVWPGHQAGVIGQICRDTVCDQAGDT